MGEEDPVEYSLVVTETGESKKSSRGFTGHATATYSNREIYEGFFEDGIREGKGSYKYANGDKFDGDFKANLKHGIGIMTYNEKGEYYGYWENGKRHGEGVFTYVNKDIYSGWWKFGKKEGTGTYVFFDTGMKLYGKWRNGNIEEGKWIFPNGTEYEGIFNNNQPTGKGKWLFKNGNVVEGQYIQSKPVDEEDEGGDLEEGEEAAKKIKVKLEWKTDPNIAAAAQLVNSVEQ